MYVSKLWLQERFKPDEVDRQGNTQKPIMKRLLPRVTPQANQKNRKILLAGVKRKPLHLVTPDNTKNKIVKHAHRTDDGILSKLSQLTRTYDVAETSGKKLSSVLHQKLIDCFQAVEKLKIAELASLRAYNDHEELKQLQTLWRTACRECLEELRQHHSAKMIDILNAFKVPACMVGYCGEEDEFKDELVSFA